MHKKAIDTFSSTVAMPSEATQKAKKPSSLAKRPLLKRVGVGVGLIALGAVGVSWLVLPKAWRETQLREATLAELEQRLAQSPADPQLLTLTAARQAQAGEYRLASETFLRAAGAGEKDLNVWLAWAASEAAAGGAAKAGGVLNLGVQRVPEIAPQLREAIERGGKLGKQATPAQLAEAICPGGLDATLATRVKGSFLNGYAEWQGRRNPAQSGAATREKLAKERPQDALIQRLWGETLLANRRYNEAVNVLEQAIALDAKSPDARFALGKALEGQGNVTQAGVAYVAALKLRPNWFPALIAAGNVANAKQLLPIALDAFERAVKQDPNSADAWVGYGRAYYNQRLRLDRAVEGFDKAYALAPKRTDYFGDYANALRANFRMDEAEKILRLRVQAAPEDARSLYLMGLILLDHKPSPEREAEAEKFLRESLKVEPEVSATQARLGRLLLSRGNTREAARLLESALRIDPYDVSATLTLARAYAQMGKTQEAERIQKSAKALSDYAQQSAYLEDQINRKPTDRKLHLQLAQHYEKGGEAEKAQKHYEMAYMLQTRSKEAERGLGALRDSTAVSRPPSR